MTRDEAISTIRQFAERLQRFLNNQPQPDEPEGLLPRSLWPKLHGSLNGNKMDQLLSWLKRNDPAGYDLVREQYEEAKRWAQAVELAAAGCPEAWFAYRKCLYHINNLRETLLEAADHLETGMSNSDGEKRGDLGGHEGGDGEWSAPMSKRRMMDQLGIDSYKTLTAWLSDKHIKQAGNRQTFVIRLDTLDTRTRRKLEKA